MTGRYKSEKDALRLAFSWSGDSSKWQESHKGGTEMMQGQTLSCKDSEEPEADPLSRENPRVTADVVETSSPASF